MFYIDSTYTTFFGHTVTKAAVLMLGSVLLIVLLSAVYSYIKKDDVYSTITYVSIFYFLGYCAELMKNRYGVLARIVGVSFSVLSINLIFKYLSKRSGIKSLKIISCFSIYLYLGLSKFGCFLNGCCFGKETNSLISVVYGNNTVCLNRNVPLFPIQLLESLIIIIIGIAIFFVSIKKDIDRYVDLLHCLLVFIYLLMIQFCDPRANLMIVNGIDYSIVMLIIDVIISLVITIKNIQYRKRMN